MSEIKIGLFLRGKIRGSIERLMTSTAFFSVLVFITTLTACSSKLEPNSVVLDYVEFGPSSMSYALIGYPWWQWLPEGGNDPKASYDIKVVVYKDMSLKSVETTYPVSESLEKDYRYVAYKDAIQYLNNSLEIVRDPSVVDLKIEETLLNTKEKINKINY